MWNRLIARWRTAFRSGWPRQIPEGPVKGADRGLRVFSAIVVVLLSLVLLAGPLTLMRPQTCRACHVPAVAYDSWRASSHASVPCQGCHTDRASLAGVGNTVGLVSDAIQAARHGAVDPVPVPDAACVSCHPDLQTQTAFVRGGLRMSHKGLAKADYRCTDCHVDAAHGVSEYRLVKPTMSMCASCHNNDKVSGTCTICHVDGKSQDEARGSDPEWSKTHGPNWRKTHGMGDLSTCVLCHDSAKCEKCHGMPLPHDQNFLPLHGNYAVKSRERCRSCHRDTFCDSCHGMPMPHPVGFLATHSKSAKNDKDPLCGRCHILGTCTQCHESHVHPGGAAR
jgi:predicted CXXCH cytochrome family protein